MAPVILVSHGSFNPIHRGHVRMFERTKALLEEQGHTVVGCEMAITNTRRMHYKGCDAMKDAVRLKLIGSAASQLRGIDGTKYHSVGQYIDGERQRMRRQYDGATAVSVEGSDFLLRYAPKNSKFMRLIVAREGEFEQATAAFRKAHGQCGLTGAVLPPEAEHAAFSSTAARKALEERNERELARICGEGVAKELLCMRKSDVYVPR